MWRFLARSKFLDPLAGQVRGRRRTVELRRDAESLPELQAKESELRAVEPSRCAAVGRCEHMSGPATDTRIAFRGKEQCLDSVTKK